MQLPLPYLISTWRYTRPLSSGSSRWAGGRSWAWPLRWGLDTGEHLCISACKIGAKDCSAGAVTIYKCTTLPGLLKLGDFTCTFPVSRPLSHSANIQSLLSVAVDDLIIWTRFVSFPLDAFYY